LRHGLSLLDEAGLETQYVGLSGQDIHACGGCFSCAKGVCVHDDDMPPILDALRRCDALLLASPVYMGMITGSLKTMMDRTVALRVKGTFELSDKIGAGIACGGFRNGGQELTLQCMHTYFLQQDMMVVSDGPPLGHSGAAIVGEAPEDEVGLQTVKNVTDRIVRALARA
jgi:multimeric flavodoxin WrbA